MKIALVHMRHAEIGGTELFLNQLSQYLCEQGEDVTIICRTHARPSHPNIKFKVLKPLSIGKAHRVYAFAKAVEKHVKEADYDIVYALGKTWSHDLIRVGGGTRKHIVELRKDKKPTLRDRISMYIEKRSFQDSKDQVVVSNSIKTKNELIEDYNVNKDDIIIIHNAVDTERFCRDKVRATYQDEINKLNIDLSLPTYLFLGSGYNRKGLDSLLSAFALIEEKSNLLIVGNESHPEAYIEKAEQLSIADRCYFLGRQEKPEMFFSIADCYILPTKYEPFGYTVIEALACGTPVITTEECGAKEVISDTVSSVLPMDFSSSQLAEKMCYWKDRSREEGFAEQCRDSVMHQSTENIMKLNYEVLKQAYQKKLSH